MNTAAQPSLIAAPVRRPGPWLLALWALLAVLGAAAALVSLPRMLLPGSGSASGLGAVIALGPGTLHELDTGRSLSIGALPWRRDLAPRGYRRFRLDLPFTLTAGAPGREAGAVWAAYHLALNDGGRVRLNGVVVGDVPGTTQTTAVALVRPQLFTLAPELLHDGTNLLSLEWATHDSLQNLAAAFVGPLDQLRPVYERRLFWQNSMARAGFDFALVSAALLLGIHAMRRGKRSYMLMGLTSLGWAFVCLAYFLPAIPASWLPAWHLLRLFGIAVAACCTWLFVLHETRSRQHRYAWICIGWGLLGPLGYLLHYAASGSIFAGRFEGLWGASMLMLGVWPLALLGRELLAHWQLRRGVIGLAVAAGLAAGLADCMMLATGSGVLGGIGYVAPAVSPIWFMAIVIVLVKDFADSITRQQQQNLLLAERLQQQHRELERLHHEQQQRAQERAAEAERQRIMQDMHDGLGSQLLSSLALAERGDLDAERTGTLLRECIDDLRLAIDSLAGDDDSFALMAGNLRFRMEPRLRAAGIALRWNSLEFDDGVPVPPARSLPLLRILQEALGNALRHSRARQITVTLATDGRGTLRLEVRDDGCGFDPQQVRRGKGLAGVEKRARGIGARFAIDSGPAGTRLQVAMPQGDGLPTPLRGETADS